MSLDLGLDKTNETEDTQQTLKNLQISLDWVKNVASPNTRNLLPDSEKMLRKLLTGSASEEFQKQYEKPIKALIEEYLEWKKSHVVEDQPVTTETQETVSEDGETDLILQSFLSVPIPIEKIKLIGVDPAYSHVFLVRAFAEKNDIAIKDGCIVPLEAYEKLVR